MKKIKIGRNSFINIMRKDNVNYQKWVTLS